MYSMYSVYSVCVNVMLLPSLLNIVGLLCTCTVCVCCSPLHRFQSSPPSGSSPTLSGTQPMSHVAPSSTVTTEGGGGGGGEYRLKEHLEAAEAELFELKSVLQAKVCCEAVSS